MCVILIGKVSEIKRVGLENAWTCNPDGAGIAYPDGKGGVRTIKGMMTLEALLDALKSVSRSTKVALHLRLATHGSVNQSNTHPFPIGRSGSVLMHNGILSAFGRSGDRGVSDSADFARLLGEIKDPKDRERLLSTVGGMFTQIDSRGIKTFGSRSWVQISRGVVASNDNFLPRVPHKNWHLLGDSQGTRLDDAWSWREGNM